MGLTISNTSGSQNFANAGANNSGAQSFGSNINSGNITTYSPRYTIEVCKLKVLLNQVPIKFLMAARLFMQFNFHPNFAKQSERKDIGAYVSQISASILEGRTVDEEIKFLGELFTQLNDRITNANVSDEQTLLSRVIRELKVLAG